MINCQTARRMLFFALILISAPLAAHHSAGMFDLTRTVALEGTVKEFQWTNPHVWIQLMVADEDGQEVEWSIEAAAPSRLFRAGWRPNSFAPGDRVTVIVNPMRDGAKGALFIGARLANGSTLGDISRL